MARNELYLCLGIMGILALGSGTETRPCMQTIHSCVLFLCKMQAEIELNDCQVYI